MNLKISKRVRVVLISAFAVIVVLLIAASIFAVRLQPMAREYVLKSLRERYKSDVEMGELRISLIPWVRASGENLVLRLNGRKDVPPMVRIRRFSASTNFWSVFRSPMHVGNVTLDGLELTLVRGEKRDHSGEEKPKVAFILDTVNVNDGKLTILPKDPAKAPLVFDLHNITLHQAGPAERMDYVADLTNPKPRGTIHTEGTFGPWNADEPADTPLEGKYTFRDADLGVFKGIQGTLSSDGSFKGHLDTIEAQGSCDVPNFSLNLAHHPMALHANYQATIDGTNGNTYLHPVKARLGKSSFEVSGAIDRDELESKKTITLEAKSGGARLEDFLRLAMKSEKPPMTGGIRFQSTVKIPPGDVDVIERLELDGQFGLGRVKFTSPDVEEKISNLSHRAQGDPKSEEGDVVAAFSGHFHLRDGVMNLPDLRFNVPGAAISLAGTYGMRGSALNFEGEARLDATVSEMTTGAKKAVLKIVDPLFKRDGAGAVLPIKISGNAGQPSFGLDIGRVMRRK